MIFVAFTTLVHEDTAFKNSTTHKIILIHIKLRLITWQSENPFVVLIIKLELQCILAGSLPIELSNQLFFCEGDNLHIVLCFILCFYQSCLNTMRVIYLECTDPFCLFWKFVMDANNFWFLFSELLKQVYSLLFF